LRVLFHYSFLLIKIVNGPHEVADLLLLIVDLFHGGRKDSGRIWDIAQCLREGAERAF
jgi:hypothetical protein